MATHTESIELKVSTPRVDLRQLDAAIAKLEAMDVLLAKKRVVLIDTKMTGGAAFSGLTKEMERATRDAKASAAEIRKAFTDAVPGAASKIKWDMSDPKKELDAIRSQIGELNRMGVKLDNYGEYTGAREAKDLAKRAERELAKLEAQFQQRESATATTTVPAATAATAAVKKTAAAETQLAGASQQSGAALANQSEILAAKRVQLLGAASGVSAMAKAETQLAAASAASAKVENSLIKTRTRGGKVISQTYQVDPGTRRTVTQRPGGAVETQAFDRVVQAREKLVALREEYGQLILDQKAAGASAVRLGSTYAAYGRELDRLAGQYKDLEKTGATAIGREAERARTLANRVQVVEVGKMERERVKAAKAEAAEREKLLIKQEEGVRRAGQRELVQMRQRAEAARLLDNLSTQGFSERSRSTRTTSKGRTMEVLGFDRETATSRESVKVMVERDRAGRLLNATTTETARVVRDAGTAARSTQRDFLTNTATVTAWAGSVFALYGALGLIGKGFESVAMIERRTAVLTQVFRGSQEEALKLRDNVLDLAVSFGRGGEEALDAAIRFSRLGLTRVEVTEAVAVALKAANVAEIDTATAAEQLSAIYAAYALNVGDLRSVLNQLNTVSNTYNVTNKDLLQGIARTSAIAKQAGLSLNELIGIIGAGVGRTGRSGAEFGNSIKSIIVALSNPKLQTKLSENFNFSVMDGAGDIKGFSDILRDLFLRYQELTDAERQAMVQQIAGKQQASRLTALLDGYVQSQILAIRASRDLTSAERENEKIRATLTSQLQGLTTQFEQFSAAVAGSNTAFGLNSGLTTTVEFLKNLLALMTAAPDAVAILLGVIGMLAARMALTAAAAGEAGVANGFFVRSMMAVRNAAQTVQASLAQMHVQYQMTGSSALAAATGLNQTAIVTNRLGNAASVALGFGKSVLRVAGWVGVAMLAMEGLNRVMESFQTQSEKANARAAGFSLELEQMRAAADASRRSARLGQTLEKLTQIPRSDRGFVAERLGLYDAEAAKLYRLGKLEESRLRLKQKVNEETALGKSQADQAETILTRELGLVNRAIQEREDYLRARNKDAGDDGELRSLLGLRGQLQGKRSEVRGEEVDMEEALNEERQAAANRVKELTEEYKNLGDAVRDVYKSFSTRGRADEVATQLAAQEEIVAMLEKERRAAEAANAARRAAAAGRRPDPQEGILVSQREALVAALADAQERARRPAAGRPGMNVVGGLSPVVATYGAAFQEADRTLATANKRLTEFDAKYSTVISRLQAEREGREAITRIGEKEGEARAEALRQQLELEQVEARKLRLAMQYAAIQDGITQGRREAGLSALAAGGGANDTENILREMRLLRGGPAREDITRAPLSIASARVDLDSARALGDQVGEAKALETLRAQGLRLEVLGFDLAQRKLSLEAQITRERRQQAEEASKNLLLADRETQLRAAAAAAFQARRGGRGLSAEEFGNLDQDTRRGIVETNPDLLPPELRTELQKLSEEYTASRSGLAEWQRQLEETVGIQAEINKLYQERMKTLTGGGDALTGITIDTNPVAQAITSAGTRAQEAINVMGLVVTRQLEGIWMALDSQASQIGVLRGRGTSLEGSAFNARIPG